MNDTPDASPSPSSRPAREYVPPPSVRKIAAAIRRAGLDRRELERELDLLPQRIFRWETQSGEPTASEAWRLARRLDISLAYLCDPDADVRDDPPGFEVAASVPTGDPAGL